MKIQIDFDQTGVQSGTWTASRDEREANDRFAIADSIIGQLGDPASGHWDVQIFTSAGRHITGDIPSEGEFVATNVR